MKEDWMVLLQAVLYTVRRRHAVSVVKGLKGKELEKAHEKDQREIREAVLRLMAETTEEQEAES